MCRSIAEVPSWSFFWSTPSASFIWTQSKIILMLRWNNSFQMVQGTVSRFFSIVQNVFRCNESSVQQPNWKTTMIWRTAVPRDWRLLAVMCVWLRAPPKTPRTSRHYGIEGFKGGLHANRVECNRWDMLQTLAIATYILITWLPNSHLFAIYLFGYIRYCY